MGVIIEFPLQSQSDTESIIDEVIDEFFSNDPATADCVKQQALSLAIELNEMKDRNISLNLTRTPSNEELSLIKQAVTQQFKHNNEIALRLFKKSLICIVKLCKN